MARTQRRRMTVLMAACLAASLIVPAATAAAPAQSDGDAKYIVTYKDRPGRADERAVERLGGKVKHRLRLIDGLAVELPPGQLKKLRSDPNVAAVEADGTIVALDHGPNTGDIEYENAWGVEHIGAREIHQAGNTGQGIKLAVIDTGIDYIHDDPDDLPVNVDPEFLDNYAGGYDFVNNDADPMDDNGHGTHVAGIAAAEKNGYLVVGVAPGVELYGLKVLGASGSGDYSGLIAALGWAVANDIDVVNISLGGHEVSAALQTAVEAAYAAGVVIVAASGNTVTLQELINGCPVVYPAAYPQSIAVSFTGTNDTLTGLSCTGPQVDFAAPGNAIFSPVPIGPCPNCSANGYRSLSGTSMASPHVAGVVALILKAGITNAGDPNTRADDIKAHLCANTAPGGGMPTTDPRYPNWYGCGVVDADKALLDNPPPGSSGPPPNSAPTATDDTATVAEDGSTSIDVLANDDDVDGDDLTVTAVTVPGLGSAVIEVDGSITYTPDLDANGPDTFDYTIEDPDGAADTATVQVTITPGNDPPDAVDDTLSAMEDLAATFDVRGNDHDVDLDALAVTSVTDPPKGTASIEPDGRVRYLPDANVSGADSFQYTVSDGAGGADTATVFVLVSPTDDVPTATGASASTPFGTAVAIGLAGTDVETCELGFEIVSGPAHGSLGPPANAACTSSSPNADTATITYTPAAGWSGPDSFTYRTGDGALFSAPVTVSITVGSPTTSVHVADLDGSATIKGTKWTAKVDVVIHNQFHGATRNVIVTGTWSNGTTGTVACTTNRSGTCSVQKANLPTSTASVRFTITSVVLTGWPYLPGANHDLDGGTNGTTVVVNRP